MNSPTLQTLSAIEPAAAATPSISQPLEAAAWEALGRGDHGAARAALVAAMESAPNDGELALALGHAEMAAGNLESALAAYWRATLLAPGLASAHSSHALTLELLGRQEEASRDALRAISLDPGDVVALKVLARIHLNAGQPEAAQQVCRLALEQNPEDGESRQLFRQALALEARLGSLLEDPSASRNVGAAAPPKPQRRPIRPPKPLAHSQ